MTFEIYEAKDGWRWRAKAGNGRIVAEGGEAYTRLTSARAAVRRLVHDVRVDNISFVVAGAWAVRP